MSAESSRLRELIRPSDRPIEIPSMIARSFCGSREFFPNGKVRDVIFDWSDEDMRFFRKVGILTSGHDVTK